MNRELIETKLIGLTYEETIVYFNNIKPLYFRPIKINNSVLLKDDNIDSNRCNIIFKHNIVIVIDGWY